MSRARLPARGLLDGHDILISPPGHRALTVGRAAACVSLGPRTVAVGDARAAANAASGPARSASRAGGRGAAVVVVMIGSVRSS
ncbi:hypothetical protein [Streptomyces sp. SAI-229]|uniref:hypothetical protein n=1 Tax=Streptomyces sp. SAI-229 TaxID=3377731 RepID=UPI003C7BB95C